MTEPETDKAALSISAHSLGRRSVAAQLADRMTCFDPAASHDEDRWLAVGSIALGSFALVFSEVIPVGILPHVSRGFGVSVGLAGLMVVVPAVTAAVAAPLLTLGSTRIERRVLLRTLSVLVLVSNAVAATAPDFGVMLIARAILGLCIGGFWVFGAGAAISLVRSEARGSAIAIVSGGIFVATVAALPIAALIGNLTTWRVAFASQVAFRPSRSSSNWSPCPASAGERGSSLGRCSPSWNFRYRGWVCWLPPPSSLPTLPGIPTSTHCFNSERG